MMNMESLDFFLIAHLLIFTIFGTIVSGTFSSDSKLDISLGGAKLEVGGSLDSSIERSQSKFDISIDGGQQANLQGNLDIGGASGLNPVQNIHESIQEISNLGSKSVGGLNIGLGDGAALGLGVAGAAEGGGGGGFGFDFARAENLNLNLEGAAKSGLDAATSVIDKTKSLTKNKIDEANLGIGEARGLQIGGSASLDLGLGGGTKTSSNLNLDTSGIGKAASDLEGKIDELKVGLENAAKSGIDQIKSKIEGKIDSLGKAGNLNLGIGENLDISFGGVTNSKSDLNLDAATTEGSVSNSTQDISLNASEISEATSKLKGTLDEIDLGVGKINTNFNISLEGPTKTMSNPNSDVEMLRETNSELNTNIKGPNLGGAGGLKFELGQPEKLDLDIDKVTKPSINLDLDASGVDKKVSEMRGKLGGDLNLGGGGSLDFGINHKLDLGSATKSALGLNLNRSEIESLDSKLRNGLSQLSGGTDSILKGNSGGLGLSPQISGGLSFGLNSTNSAQTNLGLGTFPGPNFNLQSGKAENNNNLGLAIGGAIKSEINDSNSGLGGLKLGFGSPGSWNFSLGTLGGAGNSALKSNLNANGTNKLIENSAMDNNGNLELGGTTDSKTGFEGFAGWNFGHGSGGNPGLNTKVIGDSNSKVIKNAGLNNNGNSGLGGTSGSKSGFGAFNGWNFGFGDAGKANLDSNLNAEAIDKSKYKPIGNSAINNNGNVGLGRNTDSKTGFGAFGDWNFGLGGSGKPDLNLNLSSKVMNDSKSKVTGSAGINNNGNLGSGGSKAGFQGFSGWNFGFGDAGNPTVNAKVIDDTKSKIIGNAGINNNGNSGFGGTSGAKSGFGGFSGWNFGSGDAGNANLKSNINGNTAVNNGNLGLGGTTDSKTGFGSFGSWNFGLGGSEKPDLNLNLSAKVVEGSKSKVTGSGGMNDNGSFGLGGLSDSKTGFNGFGGWNFGIGDAGKPDLKLNLSAQGTDESKSKLINNGKPELGGNGWNLGFGDGAAWNFGLGNAGKSSLQSNSAIEGSNKINKSFGELGSWNLGFGNPGGWNFGQIGRFGNGSFSGANFSVGATQGWNIGSLSASKLDVNVNASSTREANWKGATDAKLTEIGTHSEANLDSKLKGVNAKLGFGFELGEMQSPNFGFAAGTKGTLDSSLDGVQKKVDESKFKLDLGTSSNVVKPDIGLDLGGGVKFTTEGKLSNLGGDLGGINLGAGGLDGIKLGNSAAPNLQTAQQSKTEGVTEIKDLLEENNVNKPKTTMGNKIDGLGMNNTGRSKIGTGLGIQFDENTNLNSGKSAINLDKLDLSKKIDGNVGLDLHLNGGAELNLGIQGHEKIGARVAQDVSRAIQGISEGVDNIGKSAVTGLKKLESDLEGKGNLGIDANIGGDFSSNGKDTKGGLHLSIGDSQHGVETEIGGENGEVQLRFGSH